MATISWKKAASGNWNVAADWSPAKVPGVGDDAKIGIAGLYTVSLTSPVTVHSITLSDGGAVLSIAAAGKTETVTAGLTNGATVDVTGATTVNLGSLANNGMFEIADNIAGLGDSGGSTLNIGGALTNNGDLEIGNSGLTKAVTVKAASFANTAQGTINMVGGAGAGQATLKVGAAAPGILTGAYYLQGNSLVDFGSGHITTIGSNSVLRLDGALSRVASGGATGSSSALTQLATNNGFFDLEDHASVTTSAKTFTNFGEIDVDTLGGGGSRLTIAGTLNNIGSLDIGGSSLVIGGAPALVTVGGLTTPGRIFLDGGPGRATLDVLGAALPTVTSSISVEGDSLIEFASGSIAAIASGGEIDLYGPNAHIALSSNVATSGALAKLASSTGEFILEDGAAVATTVGFTNNGELDIDTSGFSQFSNDGGSSLAIGGTLTNNNSVDIGNRSITAATAVSASQLINPGAIELTGSDTVLASLKINAAAPATLAVGSYELTGDALLQFSGGGIAKIAGGVTLSLDGAHSRVAIAKTPNSNSALAGLTSNAGGFELADGASVGTTKSLTNTGTLDVDEFGDGGSSLTVAGVLTNTITLDIGNGGIIAATTVTAGGLANSATIDLTGGATISASLNVKAAAPTSVTNAAYNLAGDALLQFASGGIASIGTGGRLSLDGALSRVTSGSATGSNSALTKLAGNTGAFSLADGAAVATQAGFVNTGFLSVDTSGSGGSSLKIGGTLTNTPEANLTIGNSDILKGTTVTAKGLANTGEIALTGGTALATLDVTAAAPTTLIGSFSLSTNALLEFAGGAVTAIDSGASLTLSGKNARVATAGNLSANSALTTLASNAGSLSLEQGAVLVTKVGLTNEGNLNVDDQFFFSGGGDGGSSLTIGGGLTNDQTITIGSTSLIAATKVVTGALTNNATMTLTSGAAHAVLTVGGSLTNADSFGLDDEFSSGTTGSGGSSLTVTGVLTNSGTVQIGNANITRASTATAAGLANTGTVDLFGGTGANGGSALASLVIHAAAPSVWTGTAALSGNSLLEFTGSAIQTIGAGASISIDGPKSFVAVAGKLGSNSALAGLASNAGNFSLKGGATLALGGFANPSGGTLQVDGTSGTTSDGGSSLKINGILTNGGTLVIGNSSITKAATVTAAGLGNSGAIALSGGTSTPATLNLLGSAPTTLSGTFDLEGDSLLKFAGSSGITTIGGNLTLGGAEALVALGSKPTSNSALAGLASSTGNLDLEGGAALATTVAFDNGGGLGIDNNFDTGGSRLTIGGTLTNNTFDDITIGNGDLTAATKVTLAALANSGSVSVTGSSNATATLSLTGASTDGGQLTVSNGGVLTLGGTLTVTGSLVLDGGTVSGGTLAGTGTMETGFDQTGTLNHVTIAAGATFTAQFGRTLDDNGVTVAGAMTGGNSATLDFLNHGTDNTTNVSGFPTINLANGGKNSLTLTDANFTGTAGVITITDGDSGNTVDAHTLSSVHAISVTAGIGTDKLTGGDGGDIFTAGGNTTMTGNTGANQFRFLAAGSNTITDFKASAANELVFSNAGFNLGLSGANSIPQMMTAGEAATLFTTNKTGKFANTSQRLLYDTANHELFASADGSGSKSHVVATLTDHASIATSQLFFVT